jgi:hypothetical protein
METGWQRISVSALLAGCLVSVVFSVLAARPRFRRGSPDEPPNPLFFGQFADLPQSAYVAQVRELLADPERMHARMSADIHALGQVLRRKYRLLRGGYTAFVLAVLVSGVAALSGMLIP